MGLKTPPYKEKANEEVNQLLTRFNAISKWNYQIWDKQIVISKWNTKDDSPYLNIVRNDDTAKGTHLYIIRDSTKNQVIINPSQECQTILDLWNPTTKDGFKSSKREENKNHVEEIITGLEELTSWIPIVTKKQKKDIFDTLKFWKQKKEPQEDKRYEYPIPMSKQEEREFVTKQINLLDSIIWENSEGDHKQDQEHSSDDTIKDLRSDTFSKFKNYFWTYDGYHSQNMPHLKREKDPKNFDPYIKICGQKTEDFKTNKKLEEDQCSPQIDITYFPKEHLLRVGRRTIQLTQKEEVQIMKKFQVIIAIYEKYAPIPEDQKYKP